MSSYIHDGLNKKIGVVGRRYLDKILIIDDVLTGLGFAVRYIAAIGDFEAFVPDNCARVGLSEENFIKRLRRSQIEMARALPVSAETPLFTEIGAGKSEWMGYFVKVLQDFGAQEFGESGLSVKEVEAIGLSRRVLYDRWYGDKAKQIGYQQIALNQGAEYATMGAMILANLENPLVLGADHAKMAPFYSATAAVPVLYLRNNYVGVS